MNWREILESIKDFMLSKGIKAVVVIVLFFVFWKLIGVIVNKFYSKKNIKHMDATARTFIGSFIEIALKVLLLLATVGVLGFEASTLAAIIASIGVGIGLALQGSLSNLAGGIMLMSFKPFKVGDFIYSGQYGGTVTSLGIFYTTLRTYDNKKIFLPNGALSNDNLENVTAYDKRRVELNIKVSFDDDVEAIKKLLISLIDASELVLPDPAPVVYIMNVADYGFELSLRAWTKTETYWDLYFLMRKNLQRVIEENKLKIPYPKMDVNLNSFGGGKTTEDHDIRKI